MFAALAVIVADADAADDSVDGGADVVFTHRGVGDNVQTDVVLPGAASLDNEMAGEMVGCEMVGPLALPVMP